MSSSASDSGTGNTVEVLLNSRLGELLRSYGLDAEAEQRNVLDRSGARHQIDVVIELEGECVAIEAEFAPARTVRQDAVKRLPVEQHLLWRGEPITRVFTLVYPAEWRSNPPSATLPLLAHAPDLQFESAARVGVEVNWGGAQTGSARDLADLLLSYWTQSLRAEPIDQIVKQASDAIDIASAVLNNDPYINLPHDDSDPAATCALVWLNALLFQELLAANFQSENMPDAHRGNSIPVSQVDASVAGTLSDWKFILKINWYPIFDLACKSLSQVSPQRAQEALYGLRVCAKDMAQNQAIRRHDIAGRIFHRLLNSRKFLATNYTTIPSAVMLAGLAFGSPDGPLMSKSLEDVEVLAKSLRIVDPACGSGTLLMAALQEVAKACRAAKPSSGPPNLKPVLEESLWGYDVVPGAQHLTNTTLSMAETSRLLSGIHIYVMPHDVDSATGRARLGSLDFLERAPNHESTNRVTLFPQAGDASRTTMTGEDDKEVHMPQEVDLFITNPPYTRAGGPGSDSNTEWNPMFGSVLSEPDGKKMKTALKKTLDKTIGSQYAGLGSAFMALIDQEINDGKMLAVVLPLTAVTGSRWKPFRERLLEGYQIEWVIASHDPRNRPETQALPGRRWVSFSESTRLAEVLIIATRRKNSASIKDHIVKFANLHHNPDEPADAIALTRALTNHKIGNPITGETNMLCADIDFYLSDGNKWGEIISVPQSELTLAAWPQVVFAQCELTEAVVLLHSRQRFGDLAVPIVKLGKIVDLGPYHLQIKGKGDKGLFDCKEGTPSRRQIPALWHHKHTVTTTLQSEENAILTRRRGRKAEQDEMLERAGRLHIASELGHAPQRLAAAITGRDALGVRSWITANPKEHRPGMEEALCLWLNGTPGLLLRIIHANRPYLGRSSIPHELAATMPVLDVSKLSAERLAAAVALFDDLKEKELQGFAHIATDPVRRELNRRLVTEVLDGSGANVQYVDDLTDTLASEPLMTTRH